MSGRPRTTSFAEGNKQPLNPPLGGMKISSKSTCFNSDSDGQLVGLGRIVRHSEVTFDRNRARLRLRPQQYLPSIQYGCCRHQLILPKCNVTTSSSFEPSNVPTTRVFICHVFITDNTQSLLGHYHTHKSSLSTYTYNYLHRHQNVN